MEKDEMLAEIKKIFEQYHEPMQVWSREQIKFLLDQISEYKNFVQWMNSFTEETEEIEGYFV